MDEKDFNIRAKVIKEIFGDESKIVASVDAEELDIDRNIHQGGDIFITSDGKFIDLEFQTVDFTPEELAKYVEFAEELYEKYGKNISVYLICPNNINVYLREFEIPSKSDFTIKLACIPEDPCEIILNGIKTKIEDDEILDKDDLNLLGELHDMCEKKDKKYYLTQYIKIVNRLHY
jgi:hypothetical protein